MILRRFMKHVSNQNWFAVWLDVIVVITGIFLGMQVTEWNEVRKEKQTERTVIKRISDEAKYGLTVIDTYIASNNDIIKRSTEFIQKLDKKETCELSDKEMTDGLIAVTSFSPLDFDFMVLDELVQGGRVALIADVDVRTELSSIRSNLALLKQQWERYTRFKGVTAEVAFAAAGVVVQSGNNFDLDNQSTDVMSFRTPERLCENYNVIAQMSLALVSNMAYQAYLVRYQTALLDWQETVDKYATVINK